METMVDHPYTEDFGQSFAVDSRMATNFYRPTAILGTLLDLEKCFAELPKEVE
jgi:hypothetical protein